MVVSLGIEPATEDRRLHASKVSGSALFTGTLAMFEAAGFHEIGRTYPSRPVMRFDLAAPVP